MKTTISLINLFAGALLLLVGIGIFMDLSRVPGSAGAGLVAFAIGAACLWLAKQFAFGQKEKIA